MDVLKAILEYYDRDEIKRSRIITADSLLSQWRNYYVITTGSRDLDGILNGGIHTGRIYEFFGPAGSGKTQLALQLSINVQLDETHGGASGGAVFIDTESSFSTKRISEICSLRGLDKNKFLKGIFYASARSVADLLNLVGEIKKFLERENIRLIIIDNIADPFQIMERSHEERYLMMNKLVYILSDISYEKNIATIITNRVYSSFDQIAGERVSPFGGMCIEAFVYAKISLNRVESNIFQAKLIGTKPRTAYFKITSEGICDI